MSLNRDVHLYICDNGGDDGEVQVKFVVSGCSFAVDVSIDELQKVIGLMKEANSEAFKVQPKIRCPACGYTAEEAMHAGDHQTCRRFPFFPGEKGKSHAKIY